MIAKPVGWTTGGSPRYPEAVETGIADLEPDQVMVRIDGRQESHVGRDDSCDAAAHGSQQVCSGVRGRVVEAGADSLWFVDRAVIIPGGGRCETCDARQRDQAMAPSEQASDEDEGEGAAEFVVMRAHELCVVSVTVDWQKPIST